MDQAEIQALIEQHLTKPEQEFYKKNLKYLVDKKFIEFAYFLKHKRLFFRYLK